MYVSTTHRRLSEILNPFRALAGLGVLVKSVNFIKPPRFSRRPSSSTNERRSAARSNTFTRTIRENPSKDVM